MIKLVYGLGNPGATYAQTRHNIGQMIIQRLAENGASFQVKGKIAYFQTTEKIYIAKSTDFMNLSGQALMPFINFFKITAEEILVLHDDMEIAMAEIAHKIGGGTAGHNGLKDLQKHLGTANFQRLRLGIGRPQHGTPSDFVLRPFGKSEAELVQLLIYKAVEQINLHCKA